MSGISVKGLSDDMRLLTLAVQALVETHPNKEWFHEKFLGYVDDPETAGEHFQGLGQTDFNRTILQLLLDAASCK